MPIKSGNVKQGKFGTIASTDTSQKTLFTLPAGAMITDAMGFGTAFGGGTLTLYARPVNSTTATSFCTFTGTGAFGTGLSGSLTGTYPFNRQSVPVVITGAIDTPVSGGPVSIEVEYA